MDLSLKRGLNFGLTSGVITTLGLMVGLYSGTHTRSVVIGGVLTIAIADACSDALGMHISEEASSHRTSQQIWGATFSTFLAKFFFAFTFLVPLILLPLQLAVWASVLWGMVLLGVVSYWGESARHGKPWGAVLEHWVISGVVLLITYGVGVWVDHLFS